VVSDAAAGAAARRSGLGTWRPEKE
jgi:hypothetical protein